MKTTTPKALFNEKAEAYAERFMDQSKFHESLDLFLSSLNGKELKVLDVGCGPGNIGKYLLSKKPQLELTGIDLAPEMLRIAKTHCPTGNFIEMDAKNIGSIQEMFDGIVLGFCLPYLNKKEAIGLVETACNMLNEEGCLYLSTMEDKNENSRHQGPSSGGGPALFINFHEEGYLVETFTNSGLEVIKTFRMKDENSGNTDLVIIAKK
ncbi:MAG: class I SAM-dependent DNA methyltransferase [Bacteroidia bacterium]